MHITFCWLRDHKDLGVEVVYSANERNGRRLDQTQPAGWSNTPRVPTNFLRCVFNTHVNV